MEEIIKLYSQLGGRFLLPTQQFAERLTNIKAFVYDWDGVFNNASKNATGGSAFSEVDSMGTNLLRYAFYLKNNAMPACAIISGEKNDTAFYFSQRECFHYSFFKMSDKMHALNFICETLNIQPNEVAYFFDDVLDLSVAEKCGLRFLIGQKSNPMFLNYCITNNLADYITANKGGDHAVRECAELLIGMMGNYDQVISDRKEYVAKYKEYITKRKLITTEYFTLSDNKVIAVAKDQLLA